MIVVFFVVLYIAISQPRDRPAVVGAGAASRAVASAFSVQDGLSRGPPDRILGASAIPALRTFRSPRCGPGRRQRHPLAADRPRGRRRDCRGRGRHAGGPGTGRRRNRDEDEGGGTGCGRGRGSGRRHQGGGAGEAGHRGSTSRRGIRLGRRVLQLSHPGLHPRIANELGSLPALFHRLRDLRDNVECADCLCLVDRDRRDLSLWAFDGRAGGARRIPDRRGLGIRYHPHRHHAREHLHRRVAAVPDLRPHRGNWCGRQLHPGGGIRAHLVPQETWPCYRPVGRWWWNRCSDPQSGGPSATGQSGVGMDVPDPRLHRIWGRARRCGVLEDIWHAATQAWWAQEHAGFPEVQGLYVREAFWRRLLLGHGLLRAFCLLSSVRWNDWHQRLGCFRDLRAHQRVRCNRPDCHGILCRPRGIHEYLGRHVLYCCALHPGGVDERQELRSPPVLRSALGFRGRRVREPLRHEHGNYLGPAGTGQPPRPPLHRPHPGRARWSRDSWRHRRRLGDSRSRRDDDLQLHWAAVVQRILCVDCRDGTVLDQARVRGQEGRAGCVEGAVDANVMDGGCVQDRSIRWHRI